MVKSGTSDPSRESLKLWPNLHEYLYDDDNARIADNPDSESNAQAELRARKERASFLPVLSL